MKWCNLDNNAVLKVSGDNAQDFLQGQLTCDMREIAAGKSSFAAYCNNKGRVLAVMHVFKHLQDFYLALPNDYASKILKLLNKYAPFSRVKVELKKPFTQHIGIIGELTFEINNNHAVALKLPGDTTRYDIFCDEATFAQLTTKAIQTDSNTWLLEDIKTKIPHISEQTYASFTPHMLNLPELGAVSFSKGCYIGQEVIARTEHLGKAKRGLRHLQLPIDSKIAPGEALMQQDTEIGSAVQIVKTTQHTELLAVVSLSSEYA